MIIAPDLVWTHMAKTGGSVVHRIFEMIGDENVHLDPMTGVWSDYRRHEPFWLRSEKEGFDVTQGKVKALTIRRLPSWILSMSEFKLVKSGFDYTAEEMVKGIFRHEKRNMFDGTLVDDGEYETAMADQALEFYKPESIDIWWRQENLVTDVTKTLRKYYPISPEMEVQMRAISENVNHYNKNTDDHFSTTELEELYHNCPLWTKFETKVYGDLLV